MDLFLWRSTGWRTKGKEKVEEKESQKIKVPTRASQKENPRAKEMGKQKVRDQEIFKLEDPRDSSRREKVEMMEVEKSATIVANQATMRRIVGKLRFETFQMLCKLLQQLRDHQFLL